jgi:outer membrane protein
VGIGAVYSSSPYRDGDDAISPIPVVVYVGDKLVWFGPQARYVPVQNDLFAFSLSAEYQFGGDVFEESSFLDDMEDRENTLMVGAGVSYEAPFEVDIDLDVRTDVFGRHDGQIASLDLGRSLRWPKVRLSYGGGVTWNSSDYTGYFYGVRPGEAREDRPVYDPGDALIPFASLGLSWAPSDNWQFIINGTWEWLPGEITDSPLIVEDTQFSVITGLSYLF